MTTTTTPTSLRTLRRKVFVFAHQMIRHTTMTWSEALSYAWGYVKHNDCTLIRFTKKDGTIASRVISKEWQQFYKVKGTGRPTKPGQILFADLARVRSGQRNVIISTYTDRIIETAA